MGKVKKTEEEIIKENIKKRITTINDSFKKKKSREKFLERFNAKENDTLYKHITDYAKAKFDGETIAENYTVSVGTWQEYLVREWLDKINLEDIAVTERRKDFFKINRKDDSTEQSLSEKVQCRRLITNKNEVMGKLLDFEVPLRARSHEKSTDSPEHKGELDIVAYDKSDEKMVIIEYKIPNSTEPLLRTVLEAITYFHQINGKNPLNSKYLQSFNDVYSLSCDKIGIAILVPKSSYRFGHRRAFELIEKYNVACYTFGGDGNDFNNIEKLSVDQINGYREEANSHMQKIYDHSDFIVDNIRIN